MKPRNIVLIVLVAAALVVPAAQARTDNSAQIHALMVRGQALNRTYGLGAYTSPDAVARYVANQPAATTPSFFSDVANSAQVARNAAQGTSASGGADGTLSSPAALSGIAACLLLISIAGFMLVRRSNQHVRPV